MTGDTLHEEPHDVDDVDDVDEISGPRTEQVRIVGAERAADAVTPSTRGGEQSDEMAGVGAGADDGWGPEDWPAPEEPPMLHWTEAPTGEVPAVLSRGADVGESDPWASLPEPSWREERRDWEIDEPLAPSLMGAPGEEALLAEAADDERQPWSFDLDTPLEGAGSVEDDEETGALDDLGTGDLFGARAGDIGAGGDVEDATPFLRDAGEPAVGAAGAPSQAHDTHEIHDVGEKTTVLPLAGPAVPTEDRAASTRSGRDEAGEPAGPGPIDGGGDAGDDAAGATHPRPPSGTRQRLGRRRGEQADAAAVAADALSEAATGLRGPPSQPHPGTGTRGTSSRRPPAVPRAGDDSLSQRTGRNIPAAVASGLVIGGLALLAFHFGTVPSMVVVTVVLTAAAIEAYAAFRRAYHPATLLGLVAVAGLLVGSYDKPFAALPVVVVLLVAATFLWHLVGVDRRADPVRSTAATLLVFCWVGVFGSYAALLLAPSLFPHRTGIAYLLGALIAAVAYDVGALVVGAWAGRHPLSTVSPGKTWEGLAGGAVAAIVFAVGVVHLVHPWTLGQAAVLGVVVAVVSPVGDLCESLVKRHLGLKDMGRILPGHGGLLDRVDGLLFVLPATYYLVRAFGHG